MSNPPPYVPSFSFSGFQETNPTDPPPGPMLDNEFDNIANSVALTITALSSVRRSDGALVNGIVTPASLASDLTIGVQTPTAWVTAHAYTNGNLVVQANKFYVCLISHTSGVFATDLAALKWSEVTLSITGYSADQVTYDHAVSGLAAVNVKTALDEIDGDLDIVQTNVGTLQALEISATPIATAATVDLGATTGRYVHVTGSGATITSFGTKPAGTERTIVFEGANTIAYNVTSMITFGAVNLAIEAGDTANVVSEGSGNWRFISHRRAAVGVLPAPVETAASGTSVDFTIQAWVTAFDIVWSGISTSGTSQPRILGIDAGGAETGSYLGAAAIVTNGVSPSAGLVATGFDTGGTAAANVYHGVSSFRRAIASSNTWVCTSAISRSDAAAIYSVIGSKAMSQPLSGVRFTTAGGADTFDLGTFTLIILR